MNLDVKNPGHVEALRWACGSRSDASPNEHGSFALAAIQEPSLAASLVRDLLAVRGVQATLYDSLDDVSASSDPIIIHAGNFGIEIWTSTYHRWKTCDMPAIILAILSDDSPAAAIDALRKAGR